MKSIRVQILLWQFIAIVYCQSDGLKVKTIVGEVIGVKQKTFVNQLVYISYKGIPYAEPPVGKLRFGVPVPVKPWSKPLVTTNEYQNSCLVLGQSVLLGMKTNKSEDCLYLNVYTPVTDESKTNKKLPVLFWIHGGAYLEGDGSDLYQGADFLMEHNVVFVSINYRLGPFGFANFDTAGYTGNMGLKDQRLALKWVKENIASFGGDAESITVIGESAGGASVHFQLMSDACQYVNRAVMMSGSAFNYWSYYKENNNVNVLKEAFKEELGDKTSPEDILNFMRDAPVDVIVAKTPAFDLSATSLVFFWTPVVEDKKKAVEPILTQRPHEIYAQNKFSAHCKSVDVVLTTTSAEFMSFNNPFSPYAFTQSLKTTSPYIHIPYHGLTLAPNSMKYQKVQASIKKLYFGDKEITETPDQLNQFVQMTSDANFVVPFYETMNLHSKVGKTFCAYFDIDLNTNVNKIVRHMEAVKGMGHFEETGYLFKINEPTYVNLYNQTLKNRKDPKNKKTIDAWNFVSKLIADFAKTGSLNKIGAIKSAQNARCVHVTNDGLRSITQPKKKTIDAWNKIKTSLKAYIVDEF
ncbi:venom carboxylesterase-6-like [Contarinia nasturtii]|uniref:venom carboxylesterase-6-like n=1 Tax=Contarinia nasturtii TaxID=265458 RepID=UPI0012D474F6|nr:venom carboxylesterase-6-like [Contarinia nasturtii]